MSDLPFCKEVARGFRRQLKTLGTEADPAAIRLCGCLDDTLIIIIEPKVRSYQGVLFGMVVRTRELTPTWSDDPYELGKDLAEASIFEGGIYTVPIWELNSEYIHWDRNSVNLGLDGLLPLKVDAIAGFRWPAGFTEF